MLPVKPKETVSMVTRDGVRLDADLTQVKTLREALQVYDLDLVEREMEIEMLVIRDSK